MSAINGADVNDVVLSIELDNEYILSSADVSIDATGGANRNINISRDITDPSGSVDAIISASINGVRETSANITFDISSICSNPIDTTNANDPTGTGRSIMCDGSDNYLIDNVEDLLHLSHNKFNNTSSIGDFICSGSHKLTSNLSLSTDFTVTKTEDINGYLTGMSVILNDVAYDFNGDGTVGAGDAEGWEPLCDRYTKQFTGVFDGSGYSISNLYINRESAYQGFIGYTNAANIKNIAIKNGYIGGKSEVGPLVGHTDPDSVVENCYATSDVYNSSSQAGGLIGGGYGTIKNSYATGDVLSVSSHSGGLVGGSGGGSSNGGLIENCYATGRVKASGTAGGLIGWTGDYIQVINSYATGAVIASGDYVGGLVGWLNNDITNSYAYWSLPPVGSSL